MATSSVVDKIHVNNEKVIEEYVAAVEASANDPIIKKPSSYC